MDGFNDDYDADEMAALTDEERKAAREDCDDRADTLAQTHKDGA